MRRTRRKFLEDAFFLGAMTAGPVGLLACGGNGKEADTSGTSAASSGSAGGAGPNPGGGYVPPNDGGTWEMADPEASGWSTQGLEDLVALVGASKSNSFMLLADGRIVVEAYFNGTTVDSRFDVASVQKSVISTLVGLARAKGLLDLDDAISKYLAPGWSKASAAEEGAITLRQAMTHSTGLSPKTLAKAADPGTTYDYNSFAYQKLRLVLEAATGLGIQELSAQWLFDGIGMGSTWKDRGSVDPVGSPQWGIEASARDLARFGLLAQRKGAWGATKVLEPGWFDEAWTSSSVKNDYGLLWWLLGKGKFKGKAPSDLVAALGAKDQKVYVVPSMKVVVTRQGDAPGMVTEAESDFDAVLLEAIAAARLPT